jgi:hypothetical protein
MKDPKWVHVHEIRKWADSYMIERCLGEISYAEALCYYYDAIDSESGSFSYRWLDEPEDTCRIGKAQTL